MKRQHSCIVTFPSGKDCRHVVGPPAHWDASIDTRRDLVAIHHHATGVSAVVTAASASNFNTVVMDLKRRLGLSSSNGQSYELIRSTQSLVDRLNLNREDISIQPVHPSIMGQVSGILLTYKCCAN